jgi:hypothetical protein
MTDEPRNNDQHATAGAASDLSGPHASLGDTRSVQNETPSVDDATGGMPSQITEAMKVHLRGLEYSDEAFHEMKPGEAVRILDESGIDWRRATGDKVTNGKDADTSTDIDIHKVRVTFMENESATNLTSGVWTLPKLRDHILKTSGPTKAQLPWLKLATFGNQRSKKGSLRTDANTRSIEGIELDYDGLKMGLAEAIEIIKRMNIRALLYTSPSYSTTKLKWRILIPLSKSEPRAKEMRVKYVARINGYFKSAAKHEGNFFSGETFTLSQGYFYGRAEDNQDADHQAIIIDGQFIDLQDRLFAYQEIGAKQKPSNNEKKGSVTGFATYLALIGDGPSLGGFHDPIRSATASYASTHGRDLNPEALKTILRDTINKAPKGNARDPADIERYLSDDYLDDLIESAIEKFGEAESGTGVGRSDFVAYMPQHNYIFTPTREAWPASSVNARLRPVILLDNAGNPLLNDEGKEIRIPANAWLDKNQPVEQATWAPGLPMMIRDRLIAEGGWIEREGVTCFNLYRPPTIIPANASDVKPWLDHINKVYPDDAEHFIDWFAQRRQHPEIKINHALVFGGSPGIGKDTILEPVKRGVGPWNFSEVSPQNVTGRFNGYLKSVILRINEARDLGDIDRYQFYEHMKPYIASPPDVLRVDEKNIREHYVLNCTGVVITTNHRIDGLYLPADDRRHYVGWSDLTMADFTEEYWVRLWNWYDRGGDRNVTAYLSARDISKFNPKAPPKKTPAFWAIVDANRAPEESELADILDELENPRALTLDTIKLQAIGSNSLLYLWLNDRKNRRAIPHRLEVCGYVPVRNEASQQGLWVVNGTRQVVYASAALSTSDQLAAAAALTNPPPLNLNFWKK